MKDPKNLSGKEVISAFLPVACFFGGLFILKFYSITIGYVVLGLLFAGITGYVFFMPKKDAKAIQQAIEKHERKPIGQFLKIVNWVIFVGFVYYVGIAAAKYFGVFNVS